MRLFFRNSHSLPPTTSVGDLYFPAPLTLGLATWPFVLANGMWANTTQVKTCNAHTQWELALAPLVLATPWSEEEEMWYRTQTQSAV